MIDVNADTSYTEISSVSDPTGCVRVYAHNV